MENSKEFIGGLISRGQPLDPSFLCLESPKHLIEYAKDQASMGPNSDWDSENISGFVTGCDTFPGLLTQCWAMMYNFYCVPNYGPNVALKIRENLENSRIPEYPIRFPLTHCYS
tara:strand:+ start:4126 stop:4467 length:342 start_codon:yes stop_codon:yes gene_type:complete